MLLWKNTDEFIRGKGKKKLILFISFMSVKKTARFLSIKR